MYIVTIKPAHGLQEQELKHLFSLLPKSVPSHEYLKGITEGLFFGRQRIYTIDQYMEHINFLSGLNKPPKHCKHIKIDIQEDE